MTQTIDLIIYDKTDSFLLKPDPDFLDGNYPVVYIDAYKKTLAQVEKEVRNATKGKTIRGLSLFGHANLLEQRIGDIGLYAGSIDIQKKDPTHVTYLHRFLHNLNLKFLDNGFVILGGCKVGDASDLLTEARDALNVNAYGGQGTVSGQHKNPLFMEGHRFWNHSIVATKKGKLCQSKANRFGLDFTKLPFDPKKANCNIKLPTVYEKLKEEVIEKLKTRK